MLQPVARGRVVLLAAESSKGAGQVYVDGLELQDLRTFESARMRFVHPDRDADSRLDNVSLLVGINGAGKTTVLRAIALAVLGDTLSNTGFVPKAFIRRPPTMSVDELSELSNRTATLTVDLVAHQTDSPTLTQSGSGWLSTRLRIRAIGSREVIEDALDFEDNSSLISQEAAFSGPLTVSTAAFRFEDAKELLYDDRSDAYFMVGYPTTRRVESATSADSSARSKSRLPRYERVAGLFEESVTLMPLAAWLPDVDRFSHGRFDEIVSLINELLPEGTTFKGRREHVDYLFTQAGSQVPFDAMSDGYKSYIGWICDLLYHLNTVVREGVSLNAIPGVVLIDEIDAHLHASWQRDILPRLAMAFPKLQFVATTHSPVVVGTVEAPNLIHLRPDEAGTATVAEAVTVQLHGRNANQILLSDVFGLDSTRAADFVHEFEQTAQAAAEGDRQAAADLSDLASYGSAGRDRKSDTTFDGEASDLARNALAHARQLRESS